ncbi:MAG: hypothetical protein ABI472_16875 [Ginsengibacter sp.]
MKVIKFIFFPLFVFIASASFAQIKAVTENGDQVLLSPDGKWRYLEETKNNDSISVNPAPFAKSATANFLLKSKNSSIGFWIDPKKWDFEKSTDKTTEYSFSLKENSSVGAFVVVESVGMDLQSLRKIALDNMEKEATAFKLISEEYRAVNKLKILHIEMNATIQGISLVYLCYYYTDSYSTVQFLSYIPKNLVDQYKKTAADILNGFIVINSKNNAHTGNDDTAFQSALVPGSNCKALFKGTWSYVANGKKYSDKIEGATMIETNHADAAKSAYKIKWVSNCKYELILLHSTDKAMLLIKPGSILTIEIMEMDEKNMRFQLEYGASRVSGIMEKEG